MNFCNSLSPVKFAVGVNDSFLVQKGLHDFVDGLAQNLQSILSPLSESVLRDRDNRSSKELYVAQLSLHSRGQEKAPSLGHPKPDLCASNL